MKLLEIDFHRNGIMGKGFYIAIIEDSEVPIHGNDGKFLVTFFPEYDNDGNSLCSCCCIYYYSISISSIGIFEKMIAERNVNLEYIKERKIK